MRRAFLITLVILATVPAAFAYARSRAPLPTIGLRQVGTFDRPVGVSAPPGDPTRLFVVEQSGAIRVVKDGVRLPVPLLDITSSTGSEGERGLLSLAFAPDFVQSGLAYTYSTALDGTILVQEWHVAQGADVADATAREVLRIPHPESNHNGGQLAFGPDGLLYAGVGDGGGAGDPSGNGQNTAVPLGKILRLNPRALGAAAIPAGQPIAAGADARVFAFGLRNPWRFSFDRDTGDLWIGDVGQEDWEEVDRLPAGQGLAANLGWSCREATHVYRTDRCLGQPLTDPIYEYPHSVGVSITGGVVLRDLSVPELLGRYLYADFAGTVVYALTPGAAPVEAVTTGSISSFGEDSDGHVYVADYAGPVSQIVSNGSINRSPIASFTISNATPDVGQPVSLDASSSTDPDGNIATDAWDTDGDGRNDASGVTAQASWATPGAHTITLTVTDANGLASRRQLAVAVAGSALPQIATVSRRGPHVRITVLRRVRLRTMLRLGLGVSVRNDEPARLHISLVLPPKAAKALRIASRGEGFELGSLASRSRTTQLHGRIRPGVAVRRKLARAHATQLTVIVRATDADGNVTRLTTVVSARR